MANEQNREPETRFHEGNVVVSVWMNTGAKGRYYNATLSRSYEKEGQTHWTESLGRYDLTASAVALLRAHKWIDKELSSGEKASA